MNISHYIQELLFSKQQVALPNIGTFEFVSRPAQIDSATGTITPPSKTIRFRFNEDTGHSVLANYIAKKSKISASEALEETKTYSDHILDNLKKGDEFELEGIGVLRMLGSGSIIFLPISTYSNLGDSFGLPTLNINAQDLGNTASQQTIATTPVQEPEIMMIEDSFELIEDSGELSSNEEQAEVPIESFGTKEAEAAQKEVPAATIAKEVIVEQQLPSYSSPIEERRVFTEPEVRLTTEEGELPLEKSRNSWIWMFLVIACVVAIAFVALYHYKPSLFAFLNWNDTTRVEEPKIPEESDSSYYKAITGTLDDTAKINDSARLDSARANLQKIDSLTRTNSNTSAKTTTKAVVKDGKTRRMSKEELESIINEKLKLGTTVKNSDTQSKAPAVKPVSDPKSAAPKPVKPATQPTGGGYHVIAASVRTQAEVQREVSRLKAKGFTPQIIDNGSGKIRISVGSYPNPRQAAIAAKEAKNKLGVEAWVLNP